MKATRAIILVVAVNTFSLVLAEADSPNVTGSWKIEITFANDQHRFLRFDAQTDGKGTLTVTDPQSKVWTGAKSSEAKWAPAEGNLITFSLTFKGKFETPDSITGEVDFSPLVGDGPTKHGTFKAVREKK